jgi:hypothetical protein
MNFISIPKESRILYIYRQKSFFQNKLLDQILTISKLKQE